MACERATDAGAYALHALGDDEARDFEAHLRGCAECRAEVEELRGVVEVLPMASPQVAPPAQLRERLMREVRSEAELPARRQRRRWRNVVTRPAPAAAVACALIAAGIGTGVALQGDDTPATRTLAAQVTAPGASATLRVTGNRAALLVHNMPSPPRGGVYQVWFVKGDGKPQPTHTLFNVRDDGRATVEIEEPIDDVEQILVSAEPSGGSTAPTTTPVITARPA